ncbi:MAG: hypothetical protein KDC44_06755, partial [Phaeodactylibacter sp.]|nr:hypothetical protein [Phaeodactylibacter sp.]
MWKALFRFEFRYEARRLSTWAYCLFFLSAGLLSVAAPAGLFGSGTTDGDQLANSPAKLLQLAFFQQRLLILLIPLFVGSPWFRDLKYGVQPVLLSFQIRRVDYWLGKYLTGLALLLLCSACLFTGFGLGSTLPGLMPELLVDNRPGAYLYPWLAVIFPNLLSLSAFCFLVTTRSRSLLPSFALVLVLLLLHILLQGLLVFEDWQFTAALLDPLGQHALQLALRESESWSSLPLSSTYFLNQALWLGIGMAAWLFSLSKGGYFSSQDNKVKKRKADLSPAHIIPNPETAPYEQASPSGQFRALTPFEFQHLLRQRSTWIIAGMGIVFVLFAASRASLQHDFRLLPVSWEILAFPKQVWQFVLSVFTFLQVGLLQQRARFWDMAQLEDSAACPNWAFLSSKGLAIVLLQGLLLAALLLGSLGMQLYLGMTPQLSYAITELLGVQWLHLIIWTAAAFFVHAVIRPAYLGFFVLLIGQMGIDQLQLIGLGRPVFAFNRMEVLSYSDLCGYDRQLGAFLLYKGYWMILAIALFLLALLLQPRGQSPSLQLLRSRW